MAWVTLGVSHASGMSPAWDGASIALAAFVEEPGKLVPLLVLAVLAPGRVRRFAATDWAVLGYAIGAGFTLAEDVVRRVAVKPGLLSALLPDGTEYGLNPWTSGTLTSFDGLAIYPGHQISSANTAMTLAIGIAIWRGHAGGRRVWALVPGAATFVLSLADHASYNAHVSLLWPGKAGDGFPVVLQGVWTVAGFGRGAVLLNMGLLIVCLSLDAHRRVAAGNAGLVFLESPRPTPPVWEAALPSRVRTPLVAAWFVAWFAVTDAATVAAGFAHRPGSTRAANIATGRLTAAAVLSARARAMAATTPGSEPATRRRFGLLAATIAVSMVTVSLLLGSTIARAIGRMLTTTRDGPRFFAGLLDSLATHWERLGPLGQIAVIALGVALVLGLGGSLALALGTTGIASWALGHGHGLADFTRNPSKTTASYLTNTTPAGLLIDTADFALTFIPGSILGKLLGKPMTWLLHTAPGKLADRLLSRTARTVEDGVGVRPTVPGQPTMAGADAAADRVSGSAEGEAAGGAVSAGAGCPVSRVTAEPAGSVRGFESREAARAGLQGNLATACNRFYRGATAKSTGFQALELQDGGYRLQFFSPASNPGYGKLYVQEIDRTGQVIREYKKTLGPDGLIETKWVHGGA